MLPEESQRTFSRQRRCRGVVTSTSVTVEPVFCTFLDEDLHLRMRCTDSLNLVAPDVIILCCKVEHASAHRIPFPAPEPCLSAYIQGRTVLTSAERPLLLDNPPAPGRVFDTNHSESLFSTE